MNTYTSIQTRLSRRSLVTKGVAFLFSGTLLALMTPQAQATTNLIWHEWGPLIGYNIFPECNPGGKSDFSCGTNDISIQHESQYSDVTANVHGDLTFVNAISNIRFTNTTPDGQPIALRTYQYTYAVRLPCIPTVDSAPLIGEQIHQMIQFWDGSNTLWNANKHTLEAAIYWKLNPWDPNYGRIFVYTMNEGQLASYDTGIMLTPDTQWHIFTVDADLLNGVFAGISIDDAYMALTHVPLAQVYHPDWGEDLTLILTAESENAFPGTNNPIVTQWTTQFKDPKLFRYN